MPDGDVRHVVICRTCEPVDLGYGPQAREWDNGCPFCADDTASRHILDNPNHVVEVTRRARIPLTVESVAPAVMDRLFGRGGRRG